MDPTVNGSRIRQLELTIAWLFVASPAVGQVLRGTVLDSASGKPVAGAHLIVFLDAGATVGDGVSDADGQFTFRLPAAGNYLVRVSRPGYSTRQTQAVSVGTTYDASVRLRLASTPVPLDTLTVIGITVTVEQEIPFLAEAGFYSRQRKGIGRFLTRVDLDRHRSEPMTNALRGMSGVHVVCSGGTCDVQAPGAATMLTRGVCKPSVVLDGVTLRPGGVGSGGDQTVDQLLNPFNLEAVEVYTGSSGVPVQYKGYLSPCGTIIAWSRR